MKVGEKKWPTCRKWQVELHTESTRVLAYANEPGATSVPTRNIKHSCAILWPSSKRIFQHSKIQRFSRRGAAVARDSLRFLPKLPRVFMPNMQIYSTTASSLVHRIQVISQVKYFPVIAQSIHLRLRPSFKNNSSHPKLFIWVPTISFHRFTFDSLGLINALAKSIEIVVPLFVIC